MGMAADEEPPATLPPPHTYTIGYALQPKKIDTVIRPSVIALAAERGMRLVAVDPTRPLADQGPFHLLIHKLYDQAWRAQLEAFSALHPSVPVVDPPAAVARLLDRASMLGVVAEVNAAGRVGSLGVPLQVPIHDTSDLADPDLLAALRFPLIAKPLGVDGSAGSHAMSLVYRRDGLAGLRPPVVLQEFVNHGAVLFKVYVLGGHATCVRRRSLPDVPPERLLDLDADAAVPFANVSSLATVHADTEDDVGDDAEMPPPAFVDEVARGLRRALGLHLFNFDMIRGRKAAGGGGQYFIIDINYFPGFDKLPGYEVALTDFFDEMILFFFLIIKFHVFQPIHNQIQKHGDIPRKKRQNKFTSQIPVYNYCWFTTRDYKPQKPSCTHLEDLFFLLISTTLIYNFTYTFVPWGVTSNQPIIYTSSHKSLA